MQLGGLHHLAIKATDVEAVAAFYRDVLGLPEDRRQRDDHGLRAIWLSAPGTILMIERTAGPAPRLRAFTDEGPGLHLLALTMPAADRAAWKAHLTARGHAIAHETAYTLYVLDPEGNRVGLSSFPERSA